MGGYREGGNRGVTKVQWTNRMGVVLFWRVMSGSGKVPSREPANAIIRRHMVTPPRLSERWTYQGIQ